MKYKKVKLCQENSLDLSCFGCCGNNFGSKEDIKLDLKKNTLQFNNIKDIREFISRGKDLAASGICKHIIIKDERIICPLHPKANNGTELREGECNIYYECRTSYAFKEWPKQKQERFLSFIRSKDLDDISFSLAIDSGSLLEEFEGKEESF